MRGLHAQAREPAIEMTTVKRVISIENCTKLNIVCENTNVSLGKATLRTKPLLPIIAFRPRFVIRRKKPHGRTPDKR